MDPSTYAIFDTFADAEAALVARRDDYSPLARQVQEERHKRARLQMIAILEELRTLRKAHAQPIKQ